MIKDFDLSSHEYYIVVSNSRPYPIRVLSPVLMSTAEAGDSIEFHHKFKTNAEGASIIRSMSHKGAVGAMFYYDDFGRLEFVSIDSVECSDEGFEAHVVIPFKS